MRSAFVSAGVVTNVIVGSAPEAINIPESVPVGKGWLYDGDTFSAPVAQAPSVDQVRAEASRRMQVLVGARDAEHLSVILSNGSREAIRLIRKGADAWTETEVVRAAQLESVDAAIEQIRASSNLIEENPPTDFKQDKHWPGFTDGF